MLVSGSGWVISNLSGLYKHLIILSKSTSHFMMLDVSSCYIYIFRKSLAFNKTLVKIRFWKGETLTLEVGSILRKHSWYSSYRKHGTFPTVLWFIHIKLDMKQIETKSYYYDSTLMYGDTNSSKPLIFLFFPGISNLKPCWLHLFGISQHFQATKMGNFYSLAHRQLPRVEQEGLFLEFLVQSLGSKVQIFFVERSEPWHLDM